MAHVGDTIEHPLTGERVTFLETAGSTGGKFLRLRLDVRPGGAIPNVHVNPGSEERFAVEAAFFSENDWARLRLELWFANHTMASGRPSANAWSAIQSGLNGDAVVACDQTP
jgi:hypothetical protein